MQKRPLKGADSVTTEGMELGDLGIGLNALIEADGGEGITDETIAVTISREANDADKDGEIDYNESNTAIDDSVGSSTNSIFKKNGKIDKSAFKNFMKVIVHEGVHVVIIKIKSLIVPQEKVLKLERRLKKYLVV